MAIGVSGFDGVSVFLQAACACVICSTPHAHRLHRAGRFDVTKNLAVDALNKAFLRFLVSTLMPNPRQVVWL